MWVAFFSYNFLHHLVVHNRLWTQSNRSINWFHWIRYKKHLKHSSNRFYQYFYILSTKIFISDPENHQQIGRIGWNHDGFAVENGDTSRKCVVCGFISKVKSEIIQHFEVWCENEFCFSRENDGFESAIRKRRSSIDCLPKTGRWAIPSNEMVRSDEIVQSMFMSSWDRIIKYGHRICKTSTVFFPVENVSKLSDGFGFGSIYELPTTFVWFAQYSWDWMHQVDGGMWWVWDCQKRSSRF